MRDQAELVTHPYRRWYAVMTQPQREALAWQHLCDRDLEVFLPRFVERVGHPRRGYVVRQAKPLPGYVFLHAPAAMEWHRVTETPCITGIVKVNGEPLAARDGVIERMQALTLQGDGTLWLDRIDDELVMKPGPVPTRRKKRRGDAEPFARGSTLRILSGPFKSFNGVYVGGHDPKLQLMVDIFGRSSVAVFTEAEVAFVEPPL